MRRRDFITLVGSVAVACPLGAQAQQSERRIGALMSAAAAEEPEGQSRLGAFRDTPQQLGRTDGRNVWIESRWPDSYRKYAAELVALGPDAILAPGSASVAALTGDPHCTNRVHECRRPGWCRLCLELVPARRQYDRI